MSGTGNTNDPQDPGQQNVGGAQPPSYGASQPEQPQGGVPSYGQQEPQGQPSSQYGQPGPYGQQGAPGQPGPYGQPPQKASPMTVWAMVLGIVGLVLSLIPIVHYAAFAVGGAAIIVAIIALVKKLHRKGFAITGLVTGILAVIIAVVWSILLSVAVNMFSEVAGETASYTFEAGSDEPAEVVMITELDNMDLGTQQLPGGEVISEDVTANTLMGSVVVTNVDGSTGEVACRILDESGAVISEHSASGDGAEAMCATGEGSFGG